MSDKVVRRILKEEELDLCPFGLVHANQEEIQLLAETIVKRSDHVISVFAARNLAYNGLIALRAAHFEWQKENDGK